MQKDPAGYPESEETEIKKENRTYKIKSSGYGKSDRCFFICYKVSIISLIQKLQVIHKEIDGIFDT